VRAANVLVIEKNLWNGVSLAHKRHQHTFPDIRTDVDFGKRNFQVGKQPFGLDTVRTLALGKHSDLTHRKCSLLSGGFPLPTDTLILLSVGCFGASRTMLIY
jgi:hypothetical protein